MYIILRRNKPANKHFNGNLNSDGGKDQINIDGEKSFFGSNSFQDNIDDVSIFGGGTKNFTTRNFSGGKLTAIFGGSDIHLENCQLAHGKNDLDLFVMFGGYTIYVPHNWNVIIDVVPIFGGFSDKRIKDPNRVYEEDKVLIIKGVILFGGGEIKF
jgi:predicted membrane protein